MHGPVNVPQDISLEKSDHCILDEGFIGVVLKSDIFQVREEAHWHEKKKGGFLKHTHAGDLLISSLEKANAKWSKR